MTSSLSPMLLLHISGAVVGLLSGFFSMVMRKGSGLHRAAGQIFFGSMVLMSTTAAYVALFERPNKLNMVVGLLTCYLVVTAWRAGRRREGATGRADVVALLYIGMVTTTAYTYGFVAASSPTGTKDQMPAGIYFVFGTVSLLCTVTDIRMLRRGTLAGAHRLVRHLWRMCLALLIATVSFYPGQAKLFPAWLRETNLLMVPHVLLIGTMIFYAIRVRRTRKRAQKNAVIPVSTELHGGAAA